MNTASAALCLIRRKFVGGGLAFLALCSAGLSAADQGYAGPLIAGNLEAPPKQEASGLAPSRRAKNLLWTHDDSGGDHTLYAVDTSGRKRGALRVQGVKNEDWEDLDSFEKNGKAWLLIADAGDNDAARKTVRLHVVEEPSPESLKPDGEVVATPAYTVRFRYEDGPRDCESVAVDPVENAVYLLTKRDNPPRLYRVSLSDPGDKVATAKLVTPVPQLIGHTPVDALIKKMVGKKFSWPTAMDIAADGRSAVVVTYGEPMVFSRAAKESWADAFKRSPTRLLFHGMPQAEGACFSADGRSIYIVSETSPVLIRYDRED